MNLLAIDTARQEGGVALLLDGCVAGCVSLGTAPGFGEVLFGAIERLLSGRAVALGDLDGFAAATGPGSFTGIRVGLVAAKALAEANSKPLVGVSSLRALASCALSGGPRVALLDARRGEVFSGCFDQDLRPVRPEAVGKWDELWREVQELDPLLVANEASLFESDGPVVAGAGLPRHMAPASLAAEIGLLAARDVQAGRGQLPEAVEANYIRRPSAVPPGAVQAARR